MVVKKDASKVRRFCNRFIYVEIVTLTVGKGNWDFLQITLLYFEGAAFLKYEAAVGVRLRKSDWLVVVNRLKNNDDNRFQLEISLRNRFVNADTMVLNWKNVSAILFEL